MSQQGLTDAEIVVAILNQLADYGYGDQYFEDWQYDLAGKLAEASLFSALEAIPPHELSRMAHFCGVRKSHVPLMQAWLDAIDFYIEHQGIIWFDQAIEHYLANNYTAAAKLFIDHGFNYAYCCRGFQTGCPLHAAIRREIALSN